MIFLKYDANGRVYLKYFRPFHEQDGLNKTKEQLEQEGILVNNIPNAGELAGKDAVLYVNAEDKTLYYQYYDSSNDLTSPESEFTEIKQETQLLKAQNNALSERADFIEDVVAEMAVQVYQ